MSNSFVVGKVYSFDTYAPDVLSTRIINAKCLAILNAQNAIANGLDVISFHERMRPHLPSGHNDDPLTMTYVKLLNSAGVETIFALDWINLTTLVETKANRIVITLDNVSIEDMEVLRKSITSRGYTNISMVLTEV